MLPLGVTPADMNISAQRLWRCWRRNCAQQSAKHGDAGRCRVFSHWRTKELGVVMYKYVQAALSGYTISFRRSSRNHQIPRKFNNYDHLCVLAFQLTQKFQCLRVWRISAVNWFAWIYMICWLQYLQQIFKTNHQAANLTFTLNQISVVSTESQLKD